MKVAEFSIDDNVSHRIVPYLHERGHWVLIPEQLGIRGARDHMHLAASARHGLLLITHDEQHFRLLHQAWHAWFTEWPPVARPRHGGILLIPQNPHLTEEEAADVIDALVQDHPGGDRIADRLFRWKAATGWRELSESSG